MLNEKLGHDVVWCDGGPYDAYWLRTLFDAAGIEQTFVLGDWNTLLGGLPEVCRARILTVLGDAPPGHRAGADAERLLRALAVGIGAGN
ncbi:hypothetical protein [Xanthobacter autotrophicus]|uniref:hypothetical protein n=1 Tax=Xanthobacter autotrophicus TaxID=280 RepID=UPI00372C0A90